MLVGREIGVTALNLSSGVDAVSWCLAHTSGVGVWSVDHRCYLL